MFEINLRDNIRLKFDEEDFIIAQNYNWRLRESKTGNIIINTKIKGNIYSLKQLVFKLPENLYIVHKNDNPYDFRRSQIDIITKVDYFHKKKYGAEKTSKYKNVFYDAKKSKWGAIVVKGKAHFAGRYQTQEDAAIAADKLMTELYADKAERNFPELTLDELEEKYKELEAAYGKNQREKRAKSVQGVSVKKTPKSSKYVGVYWNNRKQKWAAEIRYLKKRYWLGLHNKEIDAAKAYDKKAIELYGEDAKINLKRC